MRASARCSVARSARTRACSSRSRAPTWRPRPRRSWSGAPRRSTIRACPAAPNPTWRSSSRRRRPGRRATCACRPTAASASPRSTTSSASSVRRAFTRSRRSRPTSSSVTWPSTCSDCRAPTEPGFPSGGTPRPLFSRPGFAKMLCTGDSVGGDTMTQARKKTTQIPKTPEDESGVDRRSFLKGAAAAGAATAAAMTAATQVARGAEAKAPKAEGEANMRGDSFIARPGSDFMLDVIKTLNIDYVASNPASSFRSLHESIVNYGGNTKPEFITCMHEESSVGIAHGYAKAPGKPMGVLCHSTVELQHAAMAVYNAWADRVPVMMFAGNGMDANKRRPGVEWTHCVQDPAGLVRDFIKWDDQPASLQHFAESTVRAYKMMMAPPQEPVLITLDIDLQEEAIHGEKLSIPKLSLSTPPQADERSLREAAKM